MVSDYSRTRCIPAPANSLSQPSIGEILPGIYNPQDDTYYTTSRNPVITWTTPGNQPRPNLAPTYIKVTGGIYFSIGLKSDGAVWTWGSNQYGQLGNGTTCDRNIPWVVKMADGTNLSNIIAIAGGGYHALALKSDGTVLSRGNNNKGQLGDETLTNRSNPVQVKFSSGMILDNVIAITGGQYYSVALKNDGTVWTWEYNNYGQLGNGASGTDQKYPVQVKINTSSFLTGIDEPNLGTVELNEARLYQKWKEYLDKQKRTFSHTK